MDQELITCLVCLTELQEDTEIVSLNCLFDENVTYGNCIEFCLGRFGEILVKHYNSAVCCDCSIELEISYKFLKKLTLSQNVLSQANEPNNSQEVFYEQETRANEENDEECGKSSAEECATEYLGVTEDWNTEEIKEVENSSSGDQEEIIQLIKTEATEEKDRQSNYNEEFRIDEGDLETQQPSVAENNDDDLIEELPYEEIPYEEIEVYTNFSDNEKAPAEPLREPERRRHAKHNCDLCGKLFPSQSRMVAHRRCHEKNRTTFNCFECGRMYATDQALTVHVRTAHNKDGFTCPICAKVFQNERSLEKHTRYHTKEFSYDSKETGKNFKGLRFICVFPNCNKLFNSSAALRDHEFSHNYFKRDIHRN